MNTRTITISTAMLYEAKNFHKVRCTETNQDYLLTKWGTFRITQADNKFICGERVRRTAHE